MIMLKAARPATLDAYEEGIRELTVHFPAGWGTIAVADETMRAEQWDIIREQTSSNAPAAYDPDLPWDFVIGQSTYGVPGALKAHWWESRVVLPLVKTASRQGPAAAATAAQLEGSFPPPVADESWGRSRRPRARRGQDTHAPQQAGRDDRVRGFEYCYAWNRQTRWEPCPNGRLHACEHCGKTNHRGNDCRTKGQGKGKGKNKKGQQPR